MSQNGFFIFLHRHAWEMQSHEVLNRKKQKVYKYIYLKFTNQNKKWSNPEKAKML